MYIESDVRAGLKRVCSAVCYFVGVDETPDCGAAIRLVMTCKKGDRRIAGDNWDQIPMLTSRTKIDAI